MRDFREYVKLMDEVNINIQNDRYQTGVTSRKLTPGEVKASKVVLKDILKEVKLSKNRTKLLKDIVSFNENNEPVITSRQKFIKLLQLASVVSIAVNDSKPNAWTLDNVEGFNRLANGMSNQEIYTLVKMDKQNREYIPSNRRK